jgi:hypothetical protein
VLYSVQCCLLSVDLSTNQRSAVVVSSDEVCHWWRDDTWRPCRRFQPTGQLFDLLEFKFYFVSDDSSFACCIIILPLSSLHNALEEHRITLDWLITRKCCDTNLGYASVSLLSPASVDAPNQGRCHTDNQACRQPKHLNTVIKLSRCSLGSVGFRMFCSLYVMLCRFRLLTVRLLRHW